MRDTFPYDKVIAYCRSESPNEACGIVVMFKGRYKWIPCKNISTSPSMDFAIHPLDFAKAEDVGEVVAIVHSHPSSSAKPSPADIASQKSQGVDWLIVGLEPSKEELVWLTGEKEVKPLYEREYIWHIQDCLSFVQDYYQQEYGITIPDYYRPERFWEQGLELYLDNYSEAGFFDISLAEAREGDVFLMSLGSNITTHCAVYLGGNKIAHHLNGRLSCKDIYGQFYRERTTRVLRHKDRKDVTNS